MEIQIQKLVASNQMMKAEMNNLQEMIDALLATFPPLPQESTSPEYPEQRDLLIEAIHVPPPLQPTIMPTMAHSQAQPTNTLGLAAPTFSGAMQQVPASYMPMPAGYLWPHAFPMQAAQGFNGVLHPYSVPHSTTWPGYVPLVATLSPFQKSQALQTYAPSMAYQHSHSSRNTIGVSTLKPLSVTSTTQQIQQQNQQGALSNMYSFSGTSSSTYVSQASRRLTSIHSQENPLPTAALHNLASKSDTPSNSTELQEESPKADALSIAFASSATSPQLLSDTAKMIATLVTQLPQHPAPQSDSHPLHLQAFSAGISSHILRPNHKVTLILEHPLMTPLVVPRFFPTPNGKTKVDPQCDLGSKDHGDIATYSLSSTHANTHCVLNSYSHPSILQARANKLYEGFFTSGYIIPSSSTPCRTLTHIHAVVLPWYDHHPHQLYCTCHGSKLLALILRDTSLAVIPIFCFDPGGVTFF